MSVDCRAIEQYLHTHIPLSKAMAVSVCSISEHDVILTAPLTPNINHRSTAFGGSISAVAILSAWTFVHVKLQVLAIPCRIVIQSNSLEYLKPIEGDFQARCIAPPQRNWDRFIAMLSRRGRGRIVLDAEVYFDGELAGKFQGEYVALELKSAV